jgi:hypothetical protein
MSPTCTARGMRIARHGRRGLALAAAAFLGCSASSAKPAPDGPPAPPAPVTCHDWPTASTVGMPSGTPTLTVMADDSYHSYHSYESRHSRLFRVQVQHVRNREGFHIDDGCLGARLRSPCAMPATACRRAYDHRMRGLVCEERDPRLFRHLGVPRPTALG